MNVKFLLIILLLLYSNTIFGYSFTYERPGTLIYVISGASFEEVVEAGDTRGQKSYGIEVFTTKFTDTKAISVTYNEGDILLVYEAESDADSIIYIKALSAPDDGTTLEPEDMTVFPSKNEVV